MKLHEIYELAIQMGREKDIRGDYLNNILEDNLKEYEKLEETDKEGFDKECLENPYADTRILVGTGNEKIQTILCGIDIESPEILLADRLREKGHQIDLVLAHHPEGIAYAALSEVMDVQADLMGNVGVPINVGEGIMAPRMREVRRGIMPANHQRAVDAARLLDLPFMCVHSPADNLVNDYLQSIFDEKLPNKLADVIELLLKLPEYQAAKKLKAGPTIIVGEKKQRAGRIFVKMTGGTSGAEKSYEKLVRAGVGTIVCMHMTEKHIKLAKENHLNVIIAGHMASDSLGMNLFLDELEKSRIKIIPCSGLIRVKRNSNNLH